MAFNGNWKRSSAENHEEVLKHMGLPAETIEVLKNAETSIVAKQDGNVIHETFKVGSHETLTIFNLEKESELTQWTGEKIKVIPKSTGPKKFEVVFDYKGVHYKVTREVASNLELVDTVDLDNGKVIGRYTYTKA